VTIVPKCIEIANTSSSFYFFSNVMDQNDYILKMQQSHPQEIAFADD
jgi:hypothetical protein